MGILSGLLGNASEVDVEKVEDNLEKILIEDEKLVRAFKVLRDLMVFTDLRLILVDKQGMTGKKMEYHTIPYESIRHFSVESTGHFDMEAELKIWTAGASEPIIRNFKKGEHIFSVQRTLAEMKLKNYDLNRF
ncbi:PH domain-containing protein [Halanaerobium sp. MA284_MarDTE_T2]|uniref:PH domain-containing protein n=1 Tax=Halanaerobium sp. MA284_MarDTE_T2 TaxID=2183913 RepID=UPI000DF374AB|nr:PH domain-containing protein [Halanaerobium sp. MA284_MarDTE_T2]RCW48787.1 PH (Pleckstrin Homology) domain-containing protein [Halanaerobium sp. MA284_MarDTE_T2]